MSHQMCRRDNNKVLGESFILPTCCASDWSRHGHFYSGRFPHPSLTIITFLQHSGTSTLLAVNSVCMWVASSQLSKARLTLRSTPVIYTYLHCLGKLESHDPERATEQILTARFTQTSRIPSLSRAKVSFNSKWGSHMLSDNRLKEKLNLWCVSRIILEEWGTGI